ncbi:MAG: hypothetical protein QNJ98_13810 [Planctomycetota bacterium]|nr:hypothetical protein [Planctomycetota bacterium]
MRVLVIGLLVLGTAAAFAEEKAKSDLALEVHLPAKVVSGEPFKLSSVFTNRGENPIELFVPEHVKRDKFPLFVFTDKEGQRWRPYNEPYSVKRAMGLRGDIATLDSGAKRTFDYEVAKFIKMQDPNSQKWNSPVPLRAGTYTVAAVHEQKSNELTYTIDGGRSAKRAYEGLWTGTITSKTVKLEVTPPRTTTLTIDSPYELYPRMPFELKLELRNGSDKPFVFDGRIEVIGASKAYGSGSVVIHAPGYEAGKSMTIAAGQVISWKVDIGELEFEPGHRAKKRHAGPVPLATILHKQGIFLLYARIGDVKQAGHVTSNELWRMRKHMW